MTLSKVGYELIILDIMSKILNFTYTLKDMNGDSGRYLSDGSWTGVVGQLATKVC